MSRPTGVDLGAVVFCVVMGVLVGLVVGFAAVGRAVGLVVGFGAVSFVVGFGARSSRERRRAPTRRSTVLAPRSLRWVRGLLPGDEGTAWWAEVTSCLAETPDPGERRRYMRSYRRGVPRLIWTSWTEHLRASRQRELL
ncbi:MAG: hypothetical protein ACRDTT_02845 [Pseudonocardiaceae bacterium]